MNYGKIGIGGKRKMEKLCKENIMVNTHIDSTKVGQDWHLPRRGITLVALVITVIILLILTGITLGFVFGKNGIIEMAQRAGKNYMEAGKQEEKDLEELYSSMLVASDDNAKITISIEDLKSIIQKEVEENTNKLQEEMEERLKQIEKKGTTKITQESVLMSSANNDLAVGTIDLRAFNNNFSEQFSNYFEYNSSDGTLTCKGDGWFKIDSCVHMTNVASSYSTTSLNIYINGIRQQGCWGEITKTGAESYDSCSETIYLNEGDILAFSKITQVQPPVTWNQATIKIIKL